MKQRLNIKMALRAWLILLFLLAGAQLASAADTAPPLYTQVAGGEHEITTRNASGGSPGLNGALRNGGQENGLRGPIRLNPADQIQ
jgi:hypothetical protein